VGNGKDDEDVDLPLPASEGGVTIQLGVQVAKMETGALVQARLDDIRVITPNGQRLDSAWRTFTSAGTNAELTPGGSGAGNLLVPMYLLIATLPGEHAKRYDEPPTPQNIQRKIQLAADCVSRKETAGVVCWYTPKSSRSQILSLVGEQFSRISLDDGR
jgi:hypothetical protein